VAASPSHLTYRFAHLAGHPQVLTSSPGGAYSNLWCSLFNADLLLSVASTALSTILSMGFLPLNLYIYLHASYGDEVLGSLRWDLLLVGVLMVTSAVLVGIAASHFISRRASQQQADRIRRRAIGVGNVSGASAGSNPRLASAGCNRYLSTAA
jgi:predicted Na+-dependent transporter